LCSLRCLDECLDGETEYSSEKLDSEDELELSTLEDYLNCEWFDLLASYSLLLVLDNFASSYSADDSIAIKLTILTVPPHYINSYIMTVFWRSNCNHSNSLKEYNILSLF
jgi:hypothetical protein